MEGDLHCAEGSRDETLMNEANASGWGGELLLRRDCLGRLHMFPGQQMNGYLLGRSHWLGF